MSKQTKLVEQPLDRELTKGTTTLYLPLDRTQGRGPEVTIMLKPAANGNIHLGMAVCSQNDPFIRRVGRRLAYHRLAGNPFIAVSGNALVEGLTSRLLNLRANRPGTVSDATLHDLWVVAEAADEKKAMAEARPVLRVVV